MVAAEDTRTTGRLLGHYGIEKPLLAVHEHNEKRVAKQVLALLSEGKSLALVSDAGTPAISDPGALLIVAVRAAGYAVRPVPGPNAAIAALSVAGSVAPHFLFYGFLPERPAARRKALVAMAQLPYALVFHEAPHRVVESVADLRQVLGGGRRLLIARELTKLFETLHACSLAEAEDWLAADANRRKGEFVLIVEGTPAAADPGDGVAQRALGILLKELPLKQAVELAARIGGGGKKALYKLALELKKGREL